MTVTKLRLNTPAKIKLRPGAQAVAQIKLSPRGVPGPKGDQGDAGGIENGTIIDGGNA